MTIKLANILHCHAMGMGIKGISAAFKLSRNTVCRYVRLFQESGIPMEQLPAMPSSRIQELFGGCGERERTPSWRQLELEALLSEYAARLKRKGVTVKSLFEEYHREHPCGYRHASFGIYLQRYRVVSRTVGHVEHYAGEQLYIDFAGDKLDVVYADIEGLMFHDIEFLNTAIQRSPEKFNRKQMSNRRESRRELFEEIEKDCLRPLPTVRYRMKERKPVTVMRNSHVTPGKHHYRNISASVSMSYTMPTRSIYSMD